jgi:hypothetical protein
MQFYFIKYMNLSYLSEKYLIIGPKINLAFSFLNSSSS